MTPEEMSYDGRPGTSRGSRCLLAPRLLTARVRRLHPGRETMQESR